MINVSTLSNVALMLMVTLILVFILAFLLKHFKKIVPQMPGSLQVLGGANLGNKTKVVLLEAYNAKLLIGVTDSQVQTLYIFKNEATIPSKPVELK